MYFVSKHSNFDEKNVIGTLIGVHDGYLYSANSFMEKLDIYRKKVFDTADWKLIWNYKVLNKNLCICTKGVSVAYGIIGDELYVATYGRKPSEDRDKLKISSIHLINNLITHYNIATNKGLSELLYRDWEGWNLCNICCLSHIIPNPADPSQIVIAPWYHKTGKCYMRHGGYIMRYRTYFSINNRKKSFSFKHMCQFFIKGKFITSNLGIIDYHKMIHFRDGELLVLVVPFQERILKIAEDSDLKVCKNVGFYNTPIGFQCLSYEPSNECLSLYDFSIDEEILEAKFTHKADFPRYPSSNNFRRSIFILDSRMLICACENYVFTFVYGMLSLSEASYISLSNTFLYDSREKVPQIKTTLENNEKYESKKKQRILGFTQNEIKKALSIPFTSDIVREFC